MTIQSWLKELKERADKATEGPWDALADEIKLMIHAQAIPIGASPPRIIQSPYPHDPTNVADFQFIAHARTDLPTAIKVIEKLLEQRDDVGYEHYFLQPEDKAEHDAEILALIKGEG